jgi:hypothetical protein
VVVDRRRVQNAKDMKIQDWPCATGFVRPRQPRQIERGTVWQRACRSGRQSRKPVAAAGASRQRPKDRRDCRAITGWPRACHCIRKLLGVTYHTWVYLGMSGQRKSLPRGRTCAARTLIRVSFSIPPLLILQRAEELFRSRGHHARQRHHQGHEP